MRLVLIGGGEHARVVIEAARTRPDLWEVNGFIDPEGNRETERRLGVSCLGSDREGRKLAATGKVQFVLGLAGLRSREARKDLAAMYDRAGAKWATVVHASSWVSPSANLSGGVFVSAGARINSGAKVKKHAVINTSAVIEHDVRIGAFAQVSPGAIVGGAGRIGAHAYLGLGSCVRDHVAVGESATVGMGAIVVAPVTRGKIVFGNPARSRGASTKK
jgi:acetyltransferase EpsM